MHIKTAMHFNPVTMPGMGTREQISEYPGVQGKAPANDPEAVQLIITDPSCPLADGEPESPDELVFLRWDNYGNVHTHPFSTRDAKKVKKVLVDLGLAK